MSEQLSVGVGPAQGSDFLGAQRAVWAMLPVSLAETSTGTELVAVDGRRPDWLDVAAEAARSGVQGVLVVRASPSPAATDVRELAEQAASNGVAIAVETAWAAHPAVAQLADAAAQTLVDVSLVDSMVVVAEDDPRPVAGILLDHLALVRAVLHGVEAVSFAARSAVGYGVNARFGSTAVALAAVRSSTARAGARLSAYAAAGEAHLEVPADGTAAPARASIVDAMGELVLPSWYESSSRAAWRRLYACVTESRPPQDLAALADDLDRVAALDW